MLNILKYLGMFPEFSYYKIPTVKTCENWINKNVNNASV